MSPAKDGAIAEVSLRPVSKDDLATFFAHQQDAEAVRMAAFTHKDPSDREAFDAHWDRLLANDAIWKSAILADGRLAGSVASWEQDGQREITYWIGREFWGRGVATRAVQAFLALYPEARPMFARAAKDNVGSIRVLEKCGFVLCGEERGFANARGEEIDEVVMRLD